MGVQKLSLPKRLVAGLGTFALASLAVFGAGTAANAAPAGEANIDFEATGSITVHKHAQPETAGEPATGADQGVLADPLEGVEFSLERVTNIDLSDETQWDQLEDLTPADVAGNLENVAGPVETNADGIVTFDELDVGVYLVTEGADNGGNNIVRTAEPFLVLLPTAVEGEWEYGLHVYPKNSLTAVSKELDETSDDAAEGAGDNIAWNVSATAPQLAPGDDLNELRYVDQLDARLDFTSVADVVYNGQVLVEDTDYTVTVDGQNVTVELTAAGRAIVEANQGQELAYVINTEVAAGADVGDGVIQNEITQFTTINDEEFDFTTPVDETYWGTVTVNKYDADNETGLGDAEFQVYRTQADAEAQDNAIAIDGETVFTTGQDGTVEIGALNAGDEQSRSYWLVETKAPSGYVLDESPREIVITPGTATETYEIPNTKQPDFELPLTGSASTGIFMLVGLALLTLGGGLYARNRRKANA